MEKMQIVGVEEGGRRKVEAQLVEMKVPLYSYGCDKKINKTLSHLKGIYSVKVDYFQQKVTVWGICNKYDVLAAIKNKRKAARFWYPEESEDNHCEQIDDQHSNKELEELSSKASVELEPEVSLDVEQRGQFPSLIKSASIHGNYYRFSLSKSRSLSLKLLGTKTRSFFTRSLSF
ncbi:Protein SODIUM POTASSIUM ROOT DEFECTIVE 1 [Linum grandiflorum]